MISWTCTPLKCTGVSLPILDVLNIDSPVSESGPAVSEALSAFSLSLDRSLPFFLLLRNIVPGLCSWLVRFRRSGSCGKP